MLSWNYRMTIRWTIVDGSNRLIVHHSHLNSLSIQRTEGKTIEVPKGNSFRDGIFHKKERDIYAFSIHHWLRECFIFHHNNFENTKSLGIYINHHQVHLFPSKIPKS